MHSDHGCRESLLLPAHPDTPQRVHLRLWGTGLHLGIELRGTLRVGNSAVAPLQPQPVLYAGGQAELRRREGPY